MSDALVAAISSGDSTAFAQWMRGAERPLRDSLRRYAALVDTEAVLQEALLRVWQVAPRYEPDGKPNGLLRLAIRIAHNLAISDIRKNKRMAAEDPTTLERLLALAERVESVAPDPHLRALIEECRAKLPEKPRIAITARLESGGTEHDLTVAERLSMKKNTFLQNITRARKLLAECLRGKGVDLEQELA